MANTELHTLARNLIATAEAELGHLSQGQRVDLLLDNIPRLKSAGEARTLVQAIAGPTHSTNIAKIITAHNAMGYERSELRVTADDVDGWLAAIVNEKTGLARMNPRASRSTVLAATRPTVAEALAALDMLCGKGGGLLKARDWSYNAMRAAEAQAGTNLRDATGAKLHEPAMMLALGLRPGQHLPAAGMPEKMIGNVRVWVEPAEPVAPAPHGAAAIVSHFRRRRTAKHRILCECPDCGWIGSAGRLHQHQTSRTCTQRINRNLQALQLATDLRG